MEICTYDVVMINKYVMLLFGTAGIKGILGEEHAKNVCMCVYVCLVMDRSRIEGVLPDI
jgi:hypothetical protein